MHVCIYNCYIYINLQLYVHINKYINKYYINYMYMYICMCVCASYILDNQRLVRPNERHQYKGCSSPACQDFK